MVAAPHTRQASQLLERGSSSRCGERRRMKPSATCHADVSARDADRFKQPFQKLLSNATPSAYSFLLFHQDASEQRKRRLHPMSALPPITPECTQRSEFTLSANRDLTRAANPALEHRGLSTNSNIEPGKSDRSTGPAQPYHSQEAGEQPTSWPLG